jgi:hypothetical protein
MVMSVLRPCFGHLKPVPLGHSLYLEFIAMFDNKDGK